MLGYITPTVGSKGHYIVTSIFRDIINRGYLYTCVGVRTIDELLLNGDTPLENIYLVNGLTESQYITDLNNGGAIALLKSEQDVIFHIPNSQLLSLPDSSGVPYISRALTVAMGYMPVELDISLLTSTVSDIVFQMYGVKATTEVVDTSEQVIIDSLTHTNYEAVRVNASGTNITSEMKYINAQEQLNVALSHIRDLEKFICDNKALLIANGKLIDRYNVPGVDLPNSNWVPLGDEFVNTYTGPLLACNVLNNVFFDASDPVSNYLHDLL